MIFAILALFGSIGLLLGGGHFPKLDTLRDGVKEHVEDKTRQMNALAALEAAEVYIKNGREQQAALAKELMGTLSRPDMTHEELDHVLARVEAIETDAFTTMLEVRRRLVKNTTPAEWALLFPAPGLPDSTATPTE